MDAELPGEGFVTAHDRTEIAYAVTGRGAPMVLTNGLTTTVNFWQYLLPHWSKRWRVLTWDMPGHGTSGRARSAQSATIAGQVPLLSRVMDEVHMPAAVHVAWSTGCQVALEMYRQHPERCRALVLLLGPAGRVLSTTRLPMPGRAIEWLVQHTPRPVFAGATRAMTYAAHAPFGQLVPRRLGLIGRGTSQQDAARITAHLRRIDSSTIQAMIASAQQHSAWDVLPEVRVPVLIVAGDRDPFAPADTVGLRMHAQCPPSELVRLPDGTHTALLDHAGEIGEVVDEFLARRLRD